MICRFCEQWNPESAQRCCFCQNRLDGDEDATSARSSTTLPPDSTAGPTFHCERPASRYGNEVPLWAVGAGLILAIGLVLLLRVCF